MKVAIIKYNAGNVQSVIYALQRMGLDPLLTDDLEYISTADKVIFPGQGEASSAMRHLKERKLDLLIPTLKQPFLGICIGLQLMCRHSEEGDTDCLGVYDLEVKKFVVDQANKGVKIPHMGWNTMENCQGELLAGLNDPFVYYVHSYYAELGKETIASTEYLHPFSAAAQKDNFYALQAHPEKSSDDGQKILENFLKL